ncbi:MAG: hypothetical protein ACKVHE_06860 [Planctomycetales bacterium]
MPDLCNSTLTQSREDAEVRKAVLCGILRLRVSEWSCDILTPHLAKATNEARLKPATWR